MSEQLEHGKPSTYNNHGCRCRNGEFGPVGCTEAWAAYMRPRVKAYRERKRKEKLERGEGL